MDHNTDEGLLPVTCTALFACTEPITGPETPETQTTPEPIGSELNEPIVTGCTALERVLKRLRERRAQTQTASVLTESEAQRAHALAQESASLAERQQAIKQEENLLRERLKSFNRRMEIQNDQKQMFNRMQEVINESTAYLKAQELTLVENQKKLNEQKRIQDDLMETLIVREDMIKLRSKALDARERKLQLTCIEQKTSELAHLRGVGLEALEAEELRELQGVVQKTARLLEHALVRRAAESEVAEEEKEFMCPIGHDLMREPVIAADGHTYDRVNIERLFALKAGETLRSPMTNAEFTKTDLYPNHALKSMIERAVDAKVAEINAR
jgi:hypothetical protein